MRRPVCATFALLLLPLLPASGLDWGASVDTSSVGFAGSRLEESLSERLEVSAFLRHYVSERAIVSGTGVYRLDADIRRDGDASVDPYLFALDTLYLRGSVPTGGQDAAPESWPSFPGLGEEQEEARGVQDYRIGRFGYQDPTDFILDDRIDGASVELHGTFSTMRLAGGYTGLIAKRRSSVEMTKTDSEDNASDSGYTAPPRAIAEWALVLPRIAQVHELGISALYQHDLRPDDELSDGFGRLSSGYGILRLQGPIGGGLFYRGVGALQVGRELSLTENGYGYSNKVAYLAGGRLRYRNREALYSLLEFGYLHSSGDEDYRSFYEGNTDGRAQMFTGMSDPGLGLVFAPRLGNLIAANAAYSFRPLSAADPAGPGKLQLQVLGYAFFRERNGAISESGLRAASNHAYLGAEANLSVRYRPFSDLGLGLDGGVFFPNTWSDDPAFHSDRRGVEYLARLTTSFSF